jgi:hypothetical protein
LMDRRGTSRLVAHALSTHHSLNLVQAHQFSRWCRLWGGSRRLRLILVLRGMLLRLEAPDICACLQLRDVFGVFIALVTRPIGL